MQAYAYIPQTHNQWQLRGKDKSFWGGRDVECTPTQPSSPMTWSTEHGENALYMRSDPLPIPCQKCSQDTLRHAVCAVNTVPFIYLGEREVQYPDAFHSPGIVHALYIRTCTHRNTISLLYKYTTILRKYSVNTLFY